MSTRGRASGALFVGMGLLALGMLMFALLLGGSSPARAETGKKALILASAVSGGASSVEATEATAKGFTVTIANDATWGAMTAAQFADYQLLVVGDPDANLPAVVSQNATALADAVMARAGGNTKVGNRILIGTDPIGHLSQGGNRLTATGIDFAGVQDGASNLYLTFTNSDPDYDSNGIGDGQDKLLPLLTIDTTPGWTQNTFPPCGGDVSLISNAAQFSTLTSANLCGWGCSVHETFPTFPADWTALAIATDTPTAPTCGTDVDSGAARCGEAYVLIAGTGIVAAAPDLALDPLTATNPVGTTHTVTATVTNPNDSPRSGVAVTFIVTGANAGATGTCVPVNCTSNASGKVTFTYTGASAGDDTINASITVGGSRQTATAAKTWVASNKAPVAVDDAYSVIGGGVLNVPAPGVLGNDTDADAGDTLTAQLVTGPSSGTLVLNPNGSFTYTPGEDTVGPVTFRYMASDGTATSNVATVTITVSAGCDGVPATIVGTQGSQTLKGTGGNDVIVGRGGNDVIDAGSGKDIICGGSGADQIEAGSGNERAFGGSGNDRLRGGSGDDVLHGEGGDDVIDGGSDDDRLFGGDGADNLKGGGDEDQLDGGQGSPDRCDGEGGTDTATLSCETRINVP